MHIHGQMNPLNAASFNGVAQNERTESNRRAAETRRKLAQSAASGSLSADSPGDDENVMVGHWLGAGPQDALPGDEYRGSHRSHEDDLA
jgi:hypothetical protein